MIRAVILALLVLGAADARANVWTDATAGQAGADADEFYTRALERGDDAAGQAAQRSMRAHVRLAAIDKAIAAYEVAAKAKPAAGEPYARIAKVIDSFFFELCDKSLTPQLLAQLTIEPSPFCDVFSPARARQMIAALDALEQRSPLDPRIASCVSRCERFERAILHTKLATHADLVAAAADYQWIIEHSDGNRNLGVEANNLAETDMMLGKLDEAITMYRLAMDYRTDVSTAYGLAVALDRDDESAEAEALIRQLGPAGFKTFHEQVKGGETFFVPDGEGEYYYALVYETYDQPLEAIRRWQAYLASGAHPQYQPRARAHIAALTAQLKLHPQIVRPVPSDFDE